MNINYESYRVFYYAAQCGSFTKAACVLSSNQPNVTRTIRNLERELGCRLFIRSKQGAVLTPEGEKLYAHVFRAVEQLQAGENEIFAAQNLLQGIVTVAVSDIALHCCLLPALRRYRKMYPGVRVRIFSGTTPDAIQTLKNALADMAIVTSPISESKILRQKRLGTVREVAIAGSDCAALRDHTWSCEDLLRYPLIGLAPHTASFSFIQQYFAEEGLRFRPDLEVAAADQILPMVQNNLGIGFLPAQLAEHELQHKTVFTLPLQRPLPPRTVLLLKQTHTVSGIAAKELENILCGSEEPN